MTNPCITTSEECRAMEAVRLLRELAKNAERLGCDLQVWDLLTALRGPDEEELRRVSWKEQTLKQWFTMTVRAATGLNFMRDIRPPEWWDQPEELEPIIESWQEYLRHVGRQERDKHAHWISHMDHAMWVLNNAQMCREKVKRAMEGAQTLGEKETDDVADR